MFATAAVVDSHRKDVRREAWDSAIAIAKDQLKDLEDEQHSRLAALGITPHEENMVQERDRETWADVFAWASRQRKRRKDLGFEDWKGIPLNVLEGFSRSDIQNVLADSRITLRLSGETGSAAWRTESQNQPLSPKKLRTIEWSVRKMVLRLLSQISNDGLSNKDGLEAIQGTSAQQSLQTKQDFSAAISKIDEKLSELQDHSQLLELPESFEAPQYPKYFSDAINDADDPNSLNATLRAILKAPIPKGACNDSMLSKICYNLLISTMPPNVHTYNQLLVKFCRREDRDLVFTVLTSMRESHIRPNEITHSTTLKFYTLLQDRVAFSKYVRLMEGLDGSLALAHPWTRRRQITAGRYRYPEEQGYSMAQFARGKDGAVVPINYHRAKDSFLSETNIAEKARVNRETYGALIYGALQLFGKEKAMQAYRAMINEGWHTNVQILTCILRDCCAKQDWLSGSMVWQEMQGLSPQPNEKAYTWMLRLCRRCEKQDAFEEVLKNATNRGILPSTVWDLGIKIRTAKVGSLLENAKWLRWSLRQKTEQRATDENGRVESEVVEQRNADTGPSLDSPEPPTNEIDPERSTISQAAVLTKNHSLGSPTCETTGPAKYLEPVLTAESEFHNTRRQLVILDSNTVAVPTIYHSGDCAPSQKPTTCREEEHAQEPPPVLHGGNLVSQNMTDLSSWERIQKPIAATA